MKLWSAFLAVACLPALGVAAGCGDKKPVNPPQPFMPYDAGPPLMVYDAGPTAPTPTAAADGWTTTGLRIEPQMAALATMPLTQLANTEAPGMTPDGVLGAANLQQGQTLEHTFQMVPGKCYTVVAVGAGITQLDIAMYVVTPLPGFAPQFGVNEKKVTPVGSQSVLGSKAKCVKLALLPTAAPIKFVITATKGQGLAAAQLYSK